MSQVISFRIEDEEFAKLDRLCTSERMKVSYWARQQVLLALDKELGTKARTVAKKKKTQPA